jgi:hypothetical protein
MACSLCATSGYTCCNLTEVVRVVPEEDTKTGDLSLLNLYRDSATSSQPYLERLRRETDIEDKIQRRNLLHSNKPRGIRRRHCFRHLQAVDIYGFTLDGKTYLLYVPITEPISQGCLIRMQMTKGTDSPFLILALSFVN